MNVLVVHVAGRSLGLQAELVREVVPLSNLTPVPTAPSPICGVSQVRGQVLPVVDLAALADEEGGAEEAARAARGGASAPRVPRLGEPLAIVEVERLRVALLVDRAEAVRVEPSLPVLDVRRALAQLRRRIAMV